MRPNGLRWLALHEIGHILGIGSGAWWYENVAAVNDTTWVMTDATALALYNRMGGSGWRGPRLLLGGVAGQGGTAHWNHCIAPQDVMASGNYWLDPDGDIQVPYITELTASSLAHGYRYDPALVRVADFNGGADGFTDFRTTGPRTTARVCKVGHREGLAEAGPHRSSTFRARDG